MVLEWRMMYGSLVRLEVRGSKFFLVREVFRFFLLLYLCFFSVCDFTKFLEGFWFLFFISLVNLVEGWVVFRF